MNPLQRPQSTQRDYSTVYTVYTLVLSISEW